MTRIDDKTMVPLGAVFMCFAATLGGVIAGSFWVKGVNDRLTRIEEKLGIPPIAEARTALESQAHAKD